MNEAYLLTGGNLGNRLNNLQIARELIEQEIGKIIKGSSVYQTAAWGFKDQPAFLNQALLISTSLQAETLMNILLMIEEQMGRKRSFKMGPRTIDIDILLFNCDIINSSNLTIPHPRLHVRKFALIPLAEIAPNLVHPVMHKTIDELLAACSDESDVYKFDENN
jgi:2-amino-4-hydroxy-6-hydroxymethyldihydropteridine diphosphokinase